MRVLKILYQTLLSSEKFCWKVLFLILVLGWYRKHYGIEGIIQCCLTVSCHEQLIARFKHNVSCTQSFRIKSSFAILWHRPAVKDLYFIFYIFYLVFINVFKKGMGYLWLCLLVFSCFKQGHNYISSAGLRICYNVIDILSSQVCNMPVKKVTVVNHLPESPNTYHWPI